MRYCNKTFHIRLTDKEYEELCRLSEVTGLTKTRYIRFMIAEISPREKTSDDYFQYFKEMHKVGNLLNQIARQIYNSGQIEYEPLEEALKLYAGLSKKILADTEHDKIDISELINIAKERTEKPNRSIKP